MPLLAWRLSDNGALQTALVLCIPFFFMPLTGTDSVAGGASTATELDMFVVLRKPVASGWSVWAKLVDPGGARKV